LGCQQEKIRILFGSFGFYLKFGACNLFLHLTALGFGHYLQSILNGIVDVGKPGNPHHTKNFLIMLGDARNADTLIALFGSGQNLNKYRYAATVDIDISPGL
jgi:hypothetical protein